MRAAINAVVIIAATVGAIAAVICIVASTYLVVSWLHNRSNNNKEMNDD